MLTAPATATTANYRQVVVGGSGSWLLLDDIANQNNLSLIRLLKKMMTILCGVGAKTAHVGAGMPVVNIV